MKLIYLSSTIILVFSRTFHWGAPGANQTRTGEHLCRPENLVHARSMGRRAADLNSPVCRGRPLLNTFSQE
jgi:hypothetical protein